MSDRTTLFDNYISKHYTHVRDPYQKRDRKRAYLRHNYQQFLPTNKHARVLDIGPGYGEFVELLVKDFGYKHVSAIDLSQEVADFCNKIIPNSTMAVQDSTTYLQQCVGQFDGIFMMHILEHLPKTEIIPFLTAAYQALTPNGRLVIEVPNMANPLIGLNIRYADFTHEVGFTELSLTYVLQSAGFANVTTTAARLPFDSYLRIPQFAVQTLTNLMLTLAYRGYAVRRPRVIAPNLCAIAVR